MRDRGMGKRGTSRTAPRLPHRSPLRVVDQVVEELAPHHLPHYALELAQAFHVFYTQCRVLGEDPPVTRARLLLLEATQAVLARTLGLMGIRIPDRM